VSSVKQDVTCHKDNRLVTITPREHENPQVVIHDELGTDHAGTWGGGLSIRRCQTGDLCPSVCRLRMMSHEASIGEKSQLEFGVTA